MGAAVGAAWMGERPVVELQFADFASCAFDPIVTLAAKTHWRSGIRLPMVIRLPSGGGVRGGPFHASSPEGWFCGTAGPQGRRARHRLRRLRPAPDRDRGRRPGALLRAQGALPPAARRGPGGGSSRGDRQRPDRSERQRRHRRDVRLGRRPRAPHRRRAGGRGVDRGRRPAHALAARPRDRARLGPSHVAAARPAGGRALAGRGERRLRARRVARGSTCSTPRR